MVIFKQAMIKYLKAPSTWIILLVSLLISGFLAGYLPFDTALIKGTPARYGYSVLMSTGVMTTMVSMFSSIFAGFKGASMFRDEIESGTFLVLLSKPISRTKIILQKWLALQVIMILFAVANIVTYEIVVACVDNYKDLQYVKAYGTGSISKNIFTVCGYMFLVLLTMGLIFSSIAMILSTKLSSATTIGISIGIGVIIPISGMIGAFTQKQEFTQLKNQTSSHFSESLLKMKNALLATGDANAQEAADGIEAAIVKINDALSAAKDPENGIYNIGIRSSDDDRFGSYFGLDLNYQLEVLGAMSSESIIPNDYKHSLTTMGVMSQLAPILRVNKDNGFDYSKWNTVDGAYKDVFDKLLAETTKVVEAGKALARIMFDDGFLVTSVNPRTKDFIKNSEWKLGKVKTGEVNAAKIQIHDMIFNPIGMFISEKRMAEAQKDSWNELIDSKYQYSNFETLLQTSTGEPNLILSQQSQDIYTYLMNVIANDRQDLIYTKLGDYVNKRTLLWCYLAFALTLVPISLLIMRKKDFR